MFPRVSRGPNQVMNNGRICFHPISILSSKILNHSSRGNLVKIKFKPEGVLFSNTNEIIPSSQGVSQHIFRESSISDVTFKPNISTSTSTAGRIYDFFDTGKISRVDSLVDELTILPPVSQLLESGRPLVDLPIRLEEIPGTYKHYTNHEAYEQIMREQMIAAQSYQGRIARTCLTTQSLPVNHAWQRLFINNPLYADKSKAHYVIGFDFQGKVRLERPYPHLDEFWYRENIKFGRDATLSFAGLNPVA